MAASDENFGLRMLLEDLEDQARAIAAFQQLHMLLVELEGLNSDSAAVEQIAGARGCEFEGRFARMGESRASVRRDQKLRKERASQRAVDVQELIGQMRRAHEDAVATNKRYRRVLKFIDATCHRSQDYEIKEITTLSPSYCELSLSRGAPEPDPVSDSRIRNVIENSPGRLSISDHVAEHRPDSSSPEPLSITDHGPGSSSPKRPSINDSCVADHRPDSSSPKRLSITGCVAEHRPDSSSPEPLSITGCVAEHRPDSSSPEPLSITGCVAEHRPDSSSPKRLSITGRVAEHRPDSSSPEPLSITEHRPGSSSPKRLSITDYVAERRPGSPSAKRWNTNDSCVEEHSPASSSFKRWSINEHRPDSSSSKRWSINEHRPDSSSSKRWSINDTVVEDRTDSSSPKRLSTNEYVVEDRPDSSASKRWSINEHRPGSSSPKRWSINDSCEEEHSPDSSSLKRLSINEHRPGSSSSSKRWSINEHRSDSSSPKRWSINGSVADHRPDSSSSKGLSIADCVAEHRPGSSAPKRWFINDSCDTEHPPDSSSKRWSISAHRPGSSSPTLSSGTLRCSAPECPKLDSSSDSSSSCSSVGATPRFGSRALSRKPPPFVPRLDLSASSELYQTPSLAPFETPSRRSTSSARLISLTDADNSARMMLSRRIKRKAKINDDKPAEEAIGARHSPCEPSILEVVEVAAMVQSAHPSTEITRKDEARPSHEHELRRSVEESLDGGLADLQASRQERRIQMLLSPTEEKLWTQTPPEHKIRRSVSPPDMKSTEMPVPFDVAESVPTKVEERGLTGLQASMQERTIQSNASTKVEEKGFADLQTSKQERRIQMLLWPTEEKLSTLRILNNTMFLWEDKPALPAAVSDDFVLSTLAAARESQRRLFDALDTVRGVPRRAVCCRAVRELVRLYPPERLVPTSFINNHHFRVSAASLRSVQDSKAAEFWQALVHHVVSLADHRMASLEESAKEFAEVLLHEMREADVVGDAHHARFELQSFLTRCFRTEPVAECRALPPQDEKQESSEESSEELLPVSDTARTYASSAPSQTEEIALDRQVRDITITRGSKSVVAAKHSRKSSLSIFSSLMFWKRKPHKVPPMDIDYFSMLNLHQNTDGSERRRRGHTSSKDYGFSLKI